MEVSAPLNLDHSQDVETFRSKIMSSSRIPQEQKEDIVANVLLLNSYFHINPGMKVFVWRAVPSKGHVYIDYDPTYSEYFVEIGNADHVFDLYKAWQLGLQINTFSSCPGFDELIKTIQSNPQKIADFMFEAEVAFICSRTLASEDFKFNQQYLINEHLRKPDFEFTSDLGKVIVECKRLHPSELQLYKRYEKLQSRLGEKIVQLGLDKTHRVEIKLSGSFSSIETLVRNFEKQVVTNNLSQDVSYKEGQNEIWILKQTTPLHFNDSFLSRHSMVSASTSLTEMSTSSAYFVMVVPEEIYRKLVTNLGSLINEANDQIPQSHIGLIFIDTPSTKALQEAWDRKDLNRDYKHILVLGIYHNQGVTLRYRSTDVDKVNQLRRLSMP